LLHVSVTSNHHQADISVHGHDMFSAYSMGSVGTRSVASGGYRATSNSGNCAEEPIIYQCYRFFCTGILSSGKKHTMVTLDRSDKVYCGSDNTRWYKFVCTVQNLISHFTNNQIVYNRQPI